MIYKKRFELVNSVDNEFKVASHHFPNDFMFPLSRDEIVRISQIVTSAKIKFSKRVRAFSEQGVATLPIDNNGQLTTNH
ncbi:MAG: ORF6N domain-containing protein [bacterium]|nr:ORF6N domain-containing protein [bacterium]